MSDLNCPTCNVSLGQDQFARGEQRQVRDDAGAVVDVNRPIYLWCQRCGGFELTFSVNEGKVIRVVSAVGPAEENRLLSKLPHRPRPPRGTRRAHTVYAPAEVPA